MHGKTVKKIVTYVLSACLDLYKVIIRELRTVQRYTSTRNSV